MKKLFNVNIRTFAAISLLLISYGCKRTPSTDENNPSDNCFYKMNFSKMPDDKNNQFSELHLNIHDNYFLYKKLTHMPLRFNENVFLSMDCTVKIEDLVLEEWMINFILNYASIEKMEWNEYQTMFEKSQSGTIIVK